VGRTAKLTSIEAVRAVAVALEKFGEAVMAALTDLDIEKRRAGDYIRIDRRKFWAAEVHRGWDRLAEAKAWLEQRQTLGKVAGHEPSCIEEKRAVQAAKRRLEIAREKTDRVRKWSQTLNRAEADYEGSLGQLTRWLEAELPVALAQLERIAQTLERYLAIESPLPEVELADEAARADGPPESSVARPHGTSDGATAAPEPADEEASQQADHRKPAPAGEAAEHADRDDEGAGRSEPAEEGKR
jgi:hypothetical protein